MLFATVGQAYVFLVTVALGAALGLGYDGVRLLSRLLRPRPAQLSLQILFWGCAVYFAFSLLVKANGGDLRAYTVLGMAVGWCLYFLSISKALSFIGGQLSRLGRRLAGARVMARLLR